MRRPGSSTISRLAPGVALALAFAAGCAFEPRGALDDDAAAPDAPGDDVDAATTDALEPDAAPHQVAHVASADATLGSEDLVFDAAATIDTGALTVTGVTLPVGVELVAAAQSPSGPELALLRVRGLTLAEGVVVRAIGSRPLVILAETASIAGTLDAGARRDQPGAGGSGPRGGIGRGGDGVRDGSYADSGGGGGGFGQPGAKGGDASGAAGGEGGLAFGDPNLDLLLGGAGGGGASSSGCDATTAGAGGGALQIYARTSIEITATGAINAGGGGGGGGRSCSLQYLAGTGGGSGGAIYLQSPVIASAGILAANGGGGGGGASNDHGGPGGDGTATTARATGGTSGGATYGAVGGRGAAQVGDATAGDNGPSLGNGGGGGGGGGRIVVSYRDSLEEGTVSPSAVKRQF